MSGGFGRAGRILSAAIVGMLKLAPVVAESHPHEFVEMAIELQFDDQGRASGIRYSWLFDEFFTAYVVEPVDKDGDGKPEEDGLDELLVEILENTREIDFFTRFDAEGFAVEFGPHKPIAASMQGRQLLINFEVAFKTAIDLNGKHLRYAVYDGEYYIAMTHSADPKAVQLNNAPAGCDWNLDLPKPDQDLTAFASALGVDETGGSNLGAAFAEWVTISCR